MSKCKYNVGDHVVIEKSNIDRFGHIYAGKTGRVVGYWTTPGGFNYHVQCDENGSTVWCNIKSLVQRDEKIVITHDGKTTTATMYEDGKKVKTATAKCCPEDTFDFMVGAKLACERLIGVPVTKYKVGDRIFAEDNIGEYPGGAWGTVVAVLDKRIHTEDYEVKFDNGYTLCSHVVPVPTTPEKSKEETEWRVVDRPIEVGDYIRITRPSFTFNTKGDILKVSAIKSNGMVGVYAENHPKETGANGKYVWNYFRGNFEVVEKVTKTVELSKPVEFTIDKPYNGKVVCIDNVRNEHIYTVGKVYEFVNGQMIANDGCEYPGCCSKITSFEDWARWTSSKFIPFVED